MKLWWDPKRKGDNLILSEENTHVLLKEDAYVFRTVVANVGFTNGVNYWEIVADERTENELKIGVTSDPNGDCNVAFCNLPTGWAYYGTRSATQVRGSCATVPPPMG
jgi:E3 ubiquitin-protein ligase NRDP1